MSSCWQWEPSLLHCIRIRTVHTPPTADICHDRYDRWWCTFSCRVLFVCKRTPNTCLFYPLSANFGYFSANLRTFCVLFTGLNSMVVWQNWQISGMTPPLQWNLINNVRWLLSKFYVGQDPHCKQIRWSIVGRNSFSYFPQREVPLKISVFFAKVAWPGVDPLEDFIFLLTLGL